MSDHSEFHDGLYESTFICNECGNRVRAVKKVEERCLKCNSKNLRKPSALEMEEIIDDFFSDGFNDID